MITWTDKTNKWNLTLELQIEISLRMTTLLLVPKFSFLRTLVKISIDCDSAI